jgi:hypothetical protein
MHQSRCELKGKDQVISRGAVDPNCTLLRELEADWRAFLHVEISQVQIRSEKGWGKRLISMALVVRICRDRCHTTQASLHFIIYLYVSGPKSAVVNTIGQGNVVAAPVPVW